MVVDAYRANNVDRDLIGGDLMKELTVRYLLNDDVYAALSEVTDLYNKVTGGNDTPDHLFSVIMIWGSDSDIKGRLDYCKQNFSANLSPEIAP